MIVKGVGIDELENVGPSATLLVDIIIHPEVLIFIISLFYIYCMSLFLL